MATSKTNRTYPKSAFPNNSYNIDILRRQVQDAGLVAITDIQPSGTDVTFVFSGLLTTANETTLDAVVAAHQGESFAQTTQAYGDELELDLTVDGVWVVSLPVDTGPLPEGLYQILWSCEIQCSAGAVVEAHALLNGVEVSQDSWDKESWHSFSNGLRWDRRAGEELEIALEARVVGAGTAKIRRRRCLVWRT